jgi:hypothetical protein
MVARWKAEFLDNISATFEKADKSEEAFVNHDELYAEIGKLKVENEFLKKVTRDSDCKGAQQAA